MNLKKGTQFLEVKKIYKLENQTVCLQDLTWEEKGLENFLHLV